ncbi:hypothetical protein, partial [Ralstonia sp. SET104]|uniref:hypothetical protein n=1 Tax=Ralstonia sp. SET104 TaxID=2448774 RepID=UPI001C8AA0A2
TRNTSSSRSAPPSPEFLDEPKKGAIQGKGKAHHLVQGVALRGLPSVGLLLCALQRLALACAFRRFGFFALGWLLELVLGWLCFGAMFWLRMGAFLCCLHWRYRSCHVRSSPF